MGEVSVIVVHVYGEDATLIVLVDDVVPVRSAAGKLLPDGCVVQSATLSDPVHVPLAPPRHSESV